ncbi:MAG TPA: GNAT family N-acetyltransferase [Chroococcales cyanobacterium]
MVLVSTSLRDMQIDVIDNLETFQVIRGNWDLVYATDPQAQFFLSWIWLLGKLKRHEAYNETWFILAAKSSTKASDYVAFFPLKILVKEHKDGGSFYNELSMAGVTESDYIGFICLPEYEKKVASAFAISIQQQKGWSAFLIENIQKTEARINLFLDSFVREDFEVHEHHYINNFDNIDNNIVPYVPLPDDWEQYLQNVVSSNTRQKIRRFLRKIEDSNEFHLTQVNEDNFEFHIEILLRLWKTNWEGRKGLDLCRRLLDQTNYTLRHCFEHKCLYLPVLWQGDKPLGAIANLMDFRKKSILFFIGSRDDTVKELPPGIVLHAYGIQYAIQHGFKVYDFMMGNEAYKYSFGAKERHIRAVVVRRKDWLGQNRKLDVRTIPKALQITANYHRANQLVEAEQGYRKILDVQAEHPDALYGLGVIMQRKGEYQTAEYLLKSLVQVQPNNIKAWFSLGVLHQIQDQLSEAQKAYQQALTLQPQSSTISLAIYHNLGYSLQKQGKWTEAIAYYQKARELQPDSIEAEVGLANALHAQGKLSPEEQARYAAINLDLGNKRRQADDLQVAIEYYQQAIAMQPDWAEAHYNLGLTLKKQGKWTEAIACYQKAQELQPDNIEAEVGFANALHAQGKLPSELKTGYAAINLDLGNKCRQADDLQVAIEYYQQALAMQPDSAEAHYNLGLALQKQGKWIEAIACYQKARELQPDSIEAEVGLAHALHVQGKLPSEEQARYATLNLDLGNKHRQAGDLKVAIQYYQQALAMQPDSADAREHLRLALQEQDNIKIKVSCAKR